MKLNIDPLLPIADDAKSLKQRLNDVLKNHAIEINRPGNLNTEDNYFAGDIRSGTVILNNFTVTNSNVDFLMTAANLKSGIITGTPTGSLSFQLPTGTNMDGAFTTLQTDQAFWWSCINLASSHSITITANTNHTIVGNALVSQSVSAQFLTRKTAPNTFVTYRAS